MKYIYFIALLIFPFFGFSQEVTSQDQGDWNKLINYLTTENWDSANMVSSLLLKKYSEININSNTAAILRYMFIRSESGMLNEQKIDKKTALKSVKKFVGLKIILPGHPLKIKLGFNDIEPLNGNTDTLFIAASNQKMAEIYSFEHIILKNKISMEDFTKNIGSFGKIEGILSSIDVAGNMFPRYEIFINDATMDVTSR